MPDSNGHAVATAGQPVQGCGLDGTSPLSRARQLAARGDAPTAPVLGALVHACITDRLLGGLQSPEVRDTYAGVRSFVAVAKAQGAVNELASEIDFAERDRRRKEKEELLARLAKIEAEEDADRPLPKKG